MTLKEMVLKNNPGCVGPQFFGGVHGCPVEYPYLNCTDTCSSTCTGYFKCGDCWNREYVPTPVTKQFEVEEFLDRDAVLDLIEAKLKTLDGDAFTAVREILTKVSRLRIFEIEEFQMEGTSKEVNNDSERDGAEV